MGKVNRSGMPQNKSASVKSTLHDRARLRGKSFEAQKDYEDREIKERDDMRKFRIPSADSMKPRQGAAKKKSSAASKEAGFRGIYDSKIGRGRD